VEIKPWSSTKNATFIVTPVFDQYYASCEEVFFCLHFLSIQMKMSSMCLSTLHPDISNSENGTNPCSPTSSWKIWKQILLYH